MHSMRDSFGGSDMLPPPLCSHSCALAVDTVGKVAVDQEEGKWLFPSWGCSKCIISLNPALGDGHYFYWRKRKLRRGEMS